MHTTERLVVSLSTSRNTNHRLYKPHGILISVRFKFDLVSIISPFTHSYIHSTGCPFIRLSTHQPLHLLVYSFIRLSIHLIFPVIRSSVCARTVVEMKKKELKIAVYYIFFVYGHEFNLKLKWFAHYYCKGVCHPQQVFIQNLKRPSDAWV